MRVLSYIIFGILTTAVNVISYYILSHLINISIISSTIVSWFLAVLFAYVTNRKYVFYSYAKGLYGIARECFAFYACRTFTAIFDILFMYIFAIVLGENDTIVKFLSNIVVIILNYLLSKLVVFRPKL